MSTVEAVQTTKSTPSTTTSGMVLQRKCACGGSAGLSGECERCKTNKLLGKPLQKKLAVSEPGDEYEQEADRVAEQVMRMSLLTPKNGQTSLSSVMLHRRTSEGASGHVEVPSIVHEVLSSSGKQLDQATRNYFEPRFGHDFSRVRVHVDQKAAQSAQAVNASAYTVGQNVVFSRGQFAPGSHDGNRLLAHELTHVVQQ